MQAQFRYLDIMCTVPARCWQLLSPWGWKDKDTLLLVQCLFTRNFGRSECINNVSLQVKHMEGGLTDWLTGDISAGMLWWYTIWSTPWFVLVIIQFFYVFCRQDALCSCFRHAGTARDQEQRWAVACLGVRRSSIYPVGAGKDPCISFLDSSSNPFHLHIHVICQSQWPCGLQPLAGRIVGSYPISEWMPVACECCVFSARDICFKPITCQEELYRMCCVWV